MEGMVLNNEQPGSRRVWMIIGLGSKHTSVMHNELFVLAGAPLTDKEITYTVR